MKREMHVYVTDPHFPPNLNNILKISYQQNQNRMHKDLLFFLRNHEVIKYFINQTFLSRDFLYQ